jgi:hypothetical protein
MLGMAGGIFVVPILTMFGHVDIRTAIGASIVSVIACSCGSAGTFLRERLTNIRLAIVLEVATTLGALTGVVLAGVVSAQVLFVLFAIVLVVSAQQMVQRRADPIVGVPAAGDRSSTPGTPGTPGAPARWAALGLDATYPDRALGGDVGYRVDRLPLGLTFMYGAGLLSALLGIGSGVLKIPAMDSALRLPIKVSSATSSFMIGVTAAASAGAYFLRGDIVAGIAGPIALGSVVGAVLGARVLLRVSNARLRVLFVGVLVALAVQMVAAAFGVELVHGAQAG